MVGTLTIEATNQITNRQVVFRCCYEQPSEWHGKKHRSPVVPLVGYLNGNKLSLEGCCGCVVKCLQDNVEFYEATVPTDGEVDLPIDCGDIKVYVKKGTLIYYAIINKNDL